MELSCQRHIMILMGTLLDKNNYRMKKSIYILFITLFPFALYGQNLRQQVAQKENKTITKVQRKKSNPVPKPEIKQETTDTIYSLRTKKQHGWFDPLRIVSKEFAMMHGQHYRFTRKNSAGHWTKMEVLDGYGNLKENNGMAPYILNVNASQHDSGINNEWLDKVKKECVFEFVADPTGDKIIQERAYDKHMNIVYTYSRVQIGKTEERKFIGSYRDYYGLPAEMRNDSAFTYGTLVVITEDIWGNDSIIQYVDAKGVPKNNGWGVSQEHYIQDKHGHVIRKQSCDIDGNPVIDMAGNCGWLAEWDNKNHFVKSEMCLDDKLKPMRMPDLLGYGEYSIGTIKQVNECDEFDRQIETRFYTDKNIPDTNAWGTHRIVYTYDDHGNQLSITGFDLNGLLSPIDNSGTAIINCSYDGKGRISSAIFLDKEQKPNSMNGYLSRKKEIYGNDDFLDEQIYWSAENGKEDTCYYYRRRSDSYYEYSNSTVKIDSLDDKGRTTYVAYFDKAMAPIIGNNINYHKKLVRYSDYGNKTIYREYYYDIDNNLHGEKPYQECQIDSVTGIYKFFNYDSNGNLIETYLQKKDKNEIALCQADMNKFGVICRSGGANSVRFYNGEVSWARKTGDISISNIIGKDEFGEPDYIYAEGDLIYYYTTNTANGSNIYYDENNEPISDFEVFRDRCPKIMTIEVTDSSAYKLGLRDNDVIISYGAYIWPMDEIINYHEFRAKWALDCVLDGTTSKNMIVFRVDPHSHEYGIVEIDNLTGAPSNLGFLTHVRFLTQRQYRRIKHTIHKEILSENPKVSKIDFSINHPKGDKYIIVGIPDMYRSERYQPYALQITDPAILLGANTKEKVVHWNITEGTDSIMNFFKKSSRYHSSGKYPQMTFYLTKNLKDIVPLYVDGRTPVVRWLDVKVSDEDYGRIEKLAKTVELQIEKDNSSVVGIKPKQLLGKWTLESDSDDNMKLTLSFMGGNRAQISAFYRVKEVISDGIDASIEVSLDLTQIKWGTMGTFISFNFDDADVDFVINDIDVLGVNPSDKEEILPALRNLVEQNKDAFLSHSNIKDSFDEVRMKSIKSGVMELEDLRNESILRFIKSKK